MKHQPKTWIALLGLAAALAMASPSMASAGESGMHGDHPGEGERIRQELGLSDEQAEQMRAIHRKYRPKLRNIHKSLHENREAMLKLDPASPDYMKQVRRLAAEKGSLTEQLTVLRARARAETAGILTPEQRQKAHALFRERLQERREHHRRHHGHPGEMPERPPFEE